MRRVVGPFGIWFEFKLLNASYRETIVIATRLIPQRPRKPILSAALWAIVYPVAACHFFLGWIGTQRLSPEWHGEPLLLFFLVGILGTVSSFALVLKWRRWGVYGLSGTWGATALLNLMSSRPLNPDAMAVGSLLIALFLLEVRRSWRFLD